MKYDLFLWCLRKEFQYIKEHLGVEFAYLYIRFLIEKVLYQHDRQMYNGILETWNKK